MQENEVPNSVIIVLFIIAILVLSIPLNIKTRANGEHIGYVTAVEDQGGIIPSNGTTVYVKTELSSSQEDTYCVPDKEVELIEELKQAARDKNNVAISFDGLILTGWFNCTGDVIKDVEVL